MKRKKYYTPKAKAELSLQFWWDKKDSTWNLMVTKNEKKHDFCLFGDPFIFGENLAKDKNLSENDKLFLDKVFNCYLRTRNEEEGGVIDVPDEDGGL